VGKGIQYTLLKMEAEGSSEWLVNMYQNIGPFSEDSNLHGAALRTSYLT
jgi:hypothetical protein